MGSVTFTIKAPADILKNKGLDAHGAVQRYIDQSALSYAEPFVPRRSGRLIASGRSATRIGSGVICYGAPYARYQYYGVSRTGKSLRYHGGGSRGSFWFARMKSAYLQKILAGAARIAGGYPDLKTSKLFDPKQNPMQVNQPIKNKFNFVPKYPEPQKPPTGRAYTKIKMPFIQL